MVDTNECNATNARMKTQMRQEGMYYNENRILNSSLIRAFVAIKIGTACNSI